MARKAKKAVKACPSGMVEFEFDGDMARPINYPKHMAKDVGGLTDLCNAVIPLFRHSPSLEVGSWGTIPRADTECEDGDYTSPTEIGGDWCLTGGLAIEASKEVRKARKGKKAGSSKKKEDAPEPEIDIEFRFEGDKAHPIIPNPHQWGDVDGHINGSHGIMDDLGLFDHLDDTGPFNWGGWEYSTTHDHGGISQSSPNDDSRRADDAWSGCNPVRISSPEPFKSYDSPPQKKTEQAAPAPMPYTVNHWATLECGDQTVHIPVNSSNVSGPEKNILDGPAKKVWKWAQEKGLTDKIGLQDAFDLAKDMHGGD